MSASINNDYILKMEKINKRFPGIQALENVDFYLKNREIMGLVGENGAGKSTLIKIIAGVYTKDSGDIFINNHKVQIHNVMDSLSMGISVIYQEFSLIPTLTIAANIFLGAERVFSKKRVFFSNKILIEESKKLMDQLRISIDPNIRIEDLGRADQQLVEILKGFRTGKSIYILDEPTASLAVHEVEKLFDTIKRVKERGVSVIFITHRLNEVIEICDNVTIIKDGKNVGTFSIKDIANFLWDTFLSVSIRLPK